MKNLRPAFKLTLRSTFCFLILSSLLVSSGCDSSSKNAGSGRSTEGDSGSVGLAESSAADTRTEDGKKFLRVPIASDGPGSMDPADGSTLYDNRCVAQIYETLLQYKYPAVAPELEPLLLDSMPEVSEDGKTYHFKLKQGIHFQDDDCFPGGKGRELVADDVLYSWKRLADSDVSIKNWWLLKDTIVGLDDYREKVSEDNKSFNYDTEIEGMQKINDQEFKIVLTQAMPKFRWTMAMFQMAIVPREAVEQYGTKFAAHPVGTGPYTMQESDWSRKKNMVMNRNPNYHDSRYPLIDRVETIFYSEDQPMWLEFKSRKIGFTTVPVDYFDEAFNKRTKTLKKSFAESGIDYQPVPLLDFIFYGFNMEDPLVGGYTDEKRKLRQAISLAIDWEERNHKFYDDICTVYDGMIPPGLDGYPENGIAKNAFRGPDLERAKKLLAEAGYPGGKGLPTIGYYTSRQGKGPEMVEMTAKHLSNIGIKINPQLDDFSAFMEEVDKKKATMFSFAWHSDYPDAENNLAMFYGPNESPGNNHFNYKNAEFDKLYEQIRTMQPGPERTKVYEQMRDIVIADAPYVGSMARVRQYLINPHLKNFQATEDFSNWYKYLDVE